MNINLISNKIRFREVEKDSIVYCHISSKNSVVCKTLAAIWHTSLAVHKFKNVINLWINNFSKVGWSVIVFF